MSLLDPEILDEVRQLPVGLTGTAAALSLLLWLFGARSHRFWLALLVTVIAGVIGLYHGRESGSGPLVAGLLLAVAAGALALSLVRLLLFFAGAVVAFLFMQFVAPEWNDWLLSGVVGGLIGAFLFRLWVATMSSFIGTLLGTYCVVGMLDHLGKLDSVPWAKQNAPLINWGIAGMTAVGLMTQLLLDRKRSKKSSKNDPKKTSDGKAENPKKEKEKDKAPPADLGKGSSGYRWFPRISLSWRKAS